MGKTAAAGTTTAVGTIVAVKQVGQATTITHNMAKVLLMPIPRFFSAACRII